MLCLEQIAGVPVLQWKLLEEIERGTRVIVSRHVEGELGQSTQHELDAAFLAGAMVAEGWAWQYVQYDKSIELRDAQAAAKKKGLGLEGRLALHRA